MADEVSQRVTRSQTRSRASLHGAMDAMAVDPEGGHKIVKARRAADASVVTKAECDLPTRTREIASAAAKPVGWTAEDRARLVRMLDKAKVVDSIMARLDNFKFRLANRHFITTGQKLCKLMREELGDGCRQEPGETVPFPATWSELHHLTTAELDSLEQFYGVSFSGKSIDERRGAFEEFLTI